MVGGRLHYSRTRRPIDSFMASTDPRDILHSKRECLPLTEEQVETFLGGYLRDEVSDAQAAALLASIFTVGMEPDELYHWTRGMLLSGEQLSWDVDRPVVDKHSTGGVGDKVSLPLAPALAACGAFVPMISGRGLGHTGGTLDKLEAIPGLRTELSLDEVRGVLGQCSVVIAAQTVDLVPADRKLYALRDATGLVGSLPLIASSIMSKKLAEGLSFLVLDVKHGSGATLPDHEQGAALASSMLEIAQRFGLHAVAFQTNMDEPLGRAVGHSLEVLESLESLRGGGPSDLRELVLTLGACVLAHVGLATDEAHGRARIAEVLDDGRALDCFAAMIAAQGGDPSFLEDPAKLPQAPDTAMFLAPASGRLDLEDCRCLGRAAVALGGGRRSGGDEIDHATGLHWNVRPGQDVHAGQELAQLYHRAGHGLDEALAELETAVAFDTGREVNQLIMRRFDQ